MLKHRKPTKKKRQRRLVDVSAGRRRLKRKLALRKLHERHRSYQMFFNLHPDSGEIAAQP